MIFLAEIRSSYNYVAISIHLQFWWWKNERMLNIETLHKLLNFNIKWSDYIYLNCIIMKRDIKVCMRSKNGIAVKVCTTLETIRWPTQIPIYVYQIMEEGKYFFRLIYVHYMFLDPLHNIISAHTYFMVQCSSSQYFFCIFGNATSEPISPL